MASWYYLHKGRPVGPVSLDEVKNQIILGQIASADLLYLEKETTWRNANSFAELKDIFTVHKNKSKLTQQTQISAESSKQTEPSKETPEWVLLVRKTNGSGYKQKGPYTKLQVEQFLKKGEVVFDDYAWRKGQSEWLKITDLPEFTIVTHKKFKNVPPVPLEKTAGVEVNLNSVFVPGDADMKSKSIRIDEVLKEESAIKRKVEEDVRKLTEPHSTDSQIRMAAMQSHQNTDIGSVGKKTVKRIKAIKKSEAAVAQAVHITPVNYYMSLTLSKKLIYPVLALAALSIVVVIVTHVSSFRDRDQVELVRPNKNMLRELKPKPNIVRNDLSPTLVQGLENQIAEPKVTLSQTKQMPSQKSTKTLPTYLRIEKNNIGRNNMTIKVNTDASEHFSIRLKFIADGGYVLSTKSYYKYIKLKKMADREFALSKYGLPQGFIILKAEIDELSEEVEAILEYGNKEVGFKKELDRYKKKISLFYSDERQSFIKTASRIERETLKLLQKVDSAEQLSSWRSFYKEWQSSMLRAVSSELKRITNKNRQQFIHAEKWLMLKDVNSKILTEAKKINKNILNGQKQNSNDIKLYVQKISKLKDEMTSSSLWR